REQQESDGPAVLLPDVISEGVATMERRDPALEGNPIAAGIMFGTSKPNLFAVDDPREKVDGVSSGATLVAAVSTTSLRQGGDCPVRLLILGGDVRLHVSCFDGHRNCGHLRLHARARREAAAGRHRSDSTGLNGVGLPSPPR